MDNQLLIIITGLAVVALGIGFLLGRWLIHRRVGLKLKLASQDYNRSKDELNQSNSALMQSQKELNLFKKTSIPEFEKLKAELELTKQELSHTQSDLINARKSASSANLNVSTESAQPNEERRTDIRRADEKQSAKLAEELIAARMKQVEEGGGSDQLGAVEVADDFFSVDIKTDETGATGFFSKPAFNPEGKGKLHEQEALIVQYIEKARKQQSQIDDLMAEKKALQQAVEQAENAAQSGDVLAQSPTDAESSFDGFVVDDAQDNTAEINNLKIELQLETQRVKELTAEVKSLTGEKASFEGAPQQAAQGDAHPPAHSLNDKSELEELRQQLKLAANNKEKLSAEVGMRIAERDELAATIEQAAVREEKLSSDVEILNARANKLRKDLNESKNQIKQLTDERDDANEQIKTKDTQLTEAGKATESLRKRKDNAELSVEVLRDENASLKKAANTFKEQFKQLQASVPSEAQLKDIELEKELQQNEILSLTRKLHHTDRINNELQQRSLEIPKLEKRLEKLDELNTVSEQQAGKIESLSQNEKRLKDQNEELRLINSEYLSLQRNNDNLSRENVKLQAQVDRIPAIIKESQDARSQVNELTALVETAQNKEIELNEKIVAAQKKEDELNVQIENARNNAAKFDAQIESALTTEIELRDQLETAQRSLKKLDDYDSMTLRLESLQDENRKLKVEIKNFDQLSANYKMMRDRNDELLDEINQFESKSEKRDDKSELIERKAAKQAKGETQLELDIEPANEKSRSTKASKAKVKKNVAAKPAMKKSPTLAKPGKKKKASVSKLSAKRKAKSKPKLQEKDDLKAINGIGPKLEKLLNDHGISTFEQLAQLSKAEADDLAIKIGSFGERITRDKWVSKAKRFVKSNKKAA